LHALSSLARLDLHTYLSITRQLICCYAGKKEEEERINHGGSDLPHRPPNQR
jgi:hypothetical protein